MGFLWVSRFFGRNGGLLKKSEPPVDNYIGSQHPRISEGFQHLSTRWCRILPPATVGKYGKSCTNVSFSMDLPIIYRVSMGFKHPNVAPELVDSLQDLSETFATVCEDRRAGMRHIRIYKYHI